MASQAAIFKAYDVRGIVPSELDAGLAYKVGRALVVFLKPEQVAVGHDMRVSGDALATAMIDGIRDQGADVIDLGLVSSDALYFAVGKYGYDAGVMITASHNPPEYNGFKICKKDARALSLDDGLDQIRDLALGGDFPEPAKRGDLVQKEVLPAYVEHALSFFDTSGFKPFKVAVDAGNGMAGRTIPLLFQHLPCELVPMYFELDGTFPNHPANPIDPAAMVDLQKTVVEQQCDLGVAFDGDADRMFLVDENGKLVGGDITTAMVAIALLEQQPKSTICYNLICSRSVPETILAHGGRPYRTPVGHSLIKKIMRAEDAIFGGEHSGHYYFRDNWYADSGLIAMLAVLRLLSKDDQPLSEIVKPIENRFRSGEINLKVDDKPAAIARVKSHFSEQGAAVDEYDGLTIEFPDRWFNLRASNTEPLLRVNVEGDTQAAMTALQDEVLWVIGAKVTASDRIRIVKLRPDGSEATSYDGVELPGPFPEDWRAFRAEWTVGVIDAGGLVFEIGDYLHEYFSPTAWFDAFALFATDGRLKGWYANVTWPTMFEDGPDGETVVWHDLFIDLIGFPDGRFQILDEDELEASGMMNDEPDIVTLILAARDTLIERFRTREFPFHDA